MNEWKSGTIYCWDTSVFFAWLKNEACHSPQDIQLVVDDIEREDAYLIVPATTYEELNYSNLTDEQKRMIDGVLSRSNVMIVDLSPPVAIKTAEIIKKSQAAGIVTKLRDARVAATAIVMQATVLHSVDADLLRLNAKDVVDNICVSKPHPHVGGYGVHGLTDGS